MSEFQRVFGGTKLGGLMTGSLSCHQAHGFFSEFLLVHCSNRGSTAGQAGVSSHAQTEMKIIW